MKSVVVAAAFAVSLLASPVFAQDEPQNIEPAGVAAQPGDVGIAAIRVIPTPLGAALPGLVTVDVTNYSVDAVLFLDGEFRLYNYDCDTGRCQAFATQLWRMLPGDRRQAYVDAVLDVLAANYPDRQIGYEVRISGYDATGDAGSLASLFPDGRRSYIGFAN